jgi:hypothetical protein
LQKLVRPENIDIDKKFQEWKRYKLHIFVITNICKPIFITFGIVGTRPAPGVHHAAELDVVQLAVAGLVELGERSLHLQPGLADFS